MKTLFIEASYKGRIRLPKKLIDKLPKSIALFTTVQFIPHLKSIKAQLKGKKVLLFRPRHSRYKGQLLGCGIVKFKRIFDAFLYIGDGSFHPKTLKVKNSKPVFVYNPYSKKHFELKFTPRKPSLAKFYASENIGVLISTKPGQQNLTKALKLRNKFADKNFYFLAFDTLDFSQLENFPFVECFVNTACQRIGIDETDKFPKPVVNLGDIKHKH